MSVNVVDAKPDVSAVGSGITLQGNALRTLRRLGVWEEPRGDGYVYDTLGLRLPDARGTPIAELDDVRTEGADLPATLGMYRPTLARVLVSRAAETGASLRFATTVTHLAEDPGGVTAAFSDGTMASTTLVVGADGIRSWTRSWLNIALTSTVPAGAQARVWKAQHFSYWMTQMMHLAPDAAAFDLRRQLGELTSGVDSWAGSRYLAEAYTGWPTCRN